MKRRVSKTVLRRKSIGRRKSIRRRKKMRGGAPTENQINDAIVLINHAVASLESRNTKGASVRSDEMEMSIERLLNALTRLGIHASSERVGYLPERPINDPVIIHAIRLCNEAIRKLRQTGSETWVEAAQAIQDALIALGVPQARLEKQSSARSYKKSVVDATLDPTIIKEVERLSQLAISELKRGDVAQARERLVEAADKLG